MNQSSLNEPAGRDCEIGLGDGQSGRATPPNSPRLSVRPFAMKAFIGSVASRLCRARRPCTNVNCWAQPFCKCVRAEWGDIQKVESRFWLAVAVSSVLVLAFAFAWVTFLS